MQTLTEIKALLEQAGHAPKKALGQNFLTDHNLIRKLVDAADLSPGDLVLEIGPGTGALSVELLERGCEVIACELDRDLAQLLRETLGQEHPDRFMLIEGDCLAGKREVNKELVDKINGRRFKLVANLPYHAATPLMLALMTQHVHCLGMFVTIQKEVVDRFGSKHGSKVFGTISVIAQCLGEVGMIAKLPPGCFWPQPSVGSAMMKWVRFETDRSLEEQADGSGIERFDASWWPIMADMTQSLFQMRRKKLSGNIKQLTSLQIDWPVGVSPDDRIDSLTPEQVRDLCHAITRANEEC
jgi:16S rRNA (adenine1518-N6/adenine1519-N6)-dimethyltransferase